MQNLSGAGLINCLRNGKLFLYFLWIAIFLVGGNCMSEQEHRELHNALASTRMEGFEVTEQTERDCVRLLSGEISVADLVKEIISRPVKAV